jgi:hypothetical protein
MTDRLTLTRAFEGAGMASEAAERIASEIYDAIHNNVATKTDLDHAVAALRAEMRETEQRLSARIDLVEHRLERQIDRVVIRLGSMIVVATGILIAIKYFG